MAIRAHRYLTLFLFFAGAAISYAIGITIGFWLLLAVGVVFELAFWFELLVRRRD